jgi:hypothetical protein
VSVTYPQPDSGTTAATPVAARLAGYVSSEQLRECPVYFEQGPTGRSLIWAEQLSTLQHETVTTDPGFNRVDVTWVSDDGAVLLVEVKGPPRSPRPETAARPLHHVVGELREQLGMSVDDAAAMCGVGRRQFYNLMSGTSARTAQERHIRKLGGLVDELSAAVESSPDRVRSLALHPVDGSTFYEAARAQDATRMDSIARRLIEAVETDQLTGAVRRPSPRRRRYARPGAVAELFGDDDGS